MVDLTTKSDEKLNLEVRVCCLFLGPVLIELFSNDVKLLSLFFYSLQLPERVIDPIINRSKCTKFILLTIRVATRVIVSA